jgi:hypothetical protein
MSRQPVLHAQQTMRGNLSAYQWLPLDSVSYAGLGAALEDEAEKPYVSAAAYESRHPTGANYFTVELTVLNEMTQALADLLGLTLPVSLKKQAHQVARCQVTI